MRTQSCGKGTAHLDVMVTVSDSGGDLSSSDVASGKTIGVL